MRWGRTQQSGGVAAAFILVNSIAGVAGHRPDVHDLSPWMPAWVASVAVGGTVGAYIGSRKARPPAFKALLAAVLVVASVKLIATR
jgi:uncharacterized membrane protein YfcA